MSEKLESNTPSDAATCSRFKPGDRVMIWKPGTDEHCATATVARVVPGSEYDPSDADGHAYVPEAPWRHRDGDYNSYPKLCLPDRLVAAANTQDQPRQSAASQVQEP